MQAPTMWQTLSDSTINKHHQFHVHVDRYPLDELPQADDDVAQWLESRWVEKGERLETWRRSLEQNNTLGDID